MKFEPISARETSLEHYSKRGIGWHGIQILYYRLQEVVDDDRQSKKEVVSYSVYLYQILSHVSRQDLVRVVSLLIVTLRQISV